MKEKIPPSHTYDADKKRPVYKKVVIEIACCPYDGRKLEDVPERVSGGLFDRQCPKCSTVW
jgi:hypothetical protein